MANTRATVLIIDDDEAIRGSLNRLFRSAGLNVQLFQSVAPYLGATPPTGPCCLVLDLNLPGQGGLDLQRELAARKSKIPIVFITGQGDVPTTVAAMKGGAIEFLTKPFHDDDLLEAVRLGLARDQARLEGEDVLRVLSARFASLTPREQEIIVQVGQGRLSRQIASEIGISEPTVKVHRSNLMRKMKAGSLPELVRMADILDLIPKGISPDALTD